MVHSQNIHHLIAEHNAEFVDFRFSDLLGQWRHITYHVSQVTEAFLKQGVMMDGSSIEGWRQIHESDMLLKPDEATAFFDPFATRPTINVLCDVVDPITEEPYERDPRSIAKKAEDYLKKSDIADAAYFGPEPEFFIFDQVRFEVSPQRILTVIEAEEANLPGSHDQDGNCVDYKKGYFISEPADSLNDLRNEMLHAMQMVGIKPEKHHHEVATCQHELGFQCGSLVETADNLLVYKYVVKQVARSYGKVATFMPKPLFGDNGSGMHVHQSLWLKGEPCFAGDQYAGLSEMALYYIGGILYHGKALNAFTNPTTNSYKRLVPGYEAPVLLTYSARNRSAACRIPTVTESRQKRIEARFPDPLANPYLAFAALLMAGLDGIKRKIHPGEAAEKNLYALTPEELQEIPAMASSLEEALNALEEDKDFLLSGNVFSQDFLAAYIALKREEARAVSQVPHPIEFKLYSGL